MRYLSYKALAAIILTVSALVFAGCDTTGSEPQTAVMSDIEALIASAEVAEALPTDSPGASKDTQGRSSSAAGLSFTLSPGRSLYYRALGSVWRQYPDLRFNVSARVSGEDLLIFVVTKDRSGNVRRVLRYANDTAALGGTEETYLDPAELTSADYYAGFLFAVRSGDGGSLRGTLTAERLRLTLRYPLDRTRAIIGGYEFGDHWLNRYCTESGLQNRRLLHTGADYYAPNFSSDEVYAAAPGTVRYARADATWGGYVVIEHTAPDGSFFTTAYTHVRPNSGIRSGVSVTNATRIGVIAPGSAGYGAHLDFKIRMRPYSSSDLTWILRGRLPEVSCVATSSGPREPAFPEHMIDPESVNWTAR